MFKYQRRTSVSFSDDVTTHEIPKLSSRETAEIYYSRSDYKKFQIAQRMREDKQEAKQIRMMIEEDVSATREAHVLELPEMQPPVDDLLLVKPPSMPVRQVSSTALVAPLGRPSPPSRQAAIEVTDIWTDTNVKNLSPRKGPPTRPVRQASKNNVNDIPIAHDVFPESPGSHLDRALAA